jgi:hypothetical protein
MSSQIKKIMNDFLNISLKGQCHKMVVKRSPWSSSLSLNYCNGRTPFFLEKVWRLKAKVRRVSHPSM